MDTIKKKYIVDENQRKIAVQIDINDFEKIEQILEDYSLGKLIEANDSEENLEINEAKSYYEKLNKNS